MKSFLRTAALVIVTTAAWSTPALASAPMGVFARVDKVTYEPDKLTSTKVRIDGVFALHTGTGGFDYSEPTAGYMYFACPAGSELECRTQWQDIEGYIGSKSMCAGWGEQNKSFGTVRPAGSTPASPDTYVLAMGVSAGQYVGGTCPKLLSFAGGTSSSGGTSGTTSGGTSGASGGTSGTTPVPTATGTTAPPNEPSTTTTNTQSGCSASPRGGAASVFGLVALAGVLAAFGRRLRGGKR